MGADLRGRAAFVSLDAFALRVNIFCMKYRVTLIESDEGWAVWCDDLPGCCSQGATRKEALANIREAILGCLTVRAEQGLPLTVRTAEVEVAVA